MARLGVIAMRRAGLIVALGALPGLFIVAGAVTLTSPDGIHTTALSRHGHIEVNVCAALS